MTSPGRIGFRAASWTRKTGFQKVLAVRKKQLGNWHLNSLVTQRELILSSCAMKIPPSAWDSPALASTLEFVGPRPASPKDSTPRSYALKKLHDGTWSYKGSLLETHMVRRDMDENLGRDHPETLTSEMWTTVLKFQEGRPDWYYDVSYFDTYSVHLRSDAVVGSRFLWAMKMCLWVGRISLDNGRPGNALKIF